MKNLLCGNGPLVVPLVMHKIVRDGKKSAFEDISTSLFKRILEFIKMRGILLDAAPSEVESLPISYYLTFDDGNSSDADIALPLLLEMNCSATFFLIADKINTPNFISYTQARELVNYGMALGSHSVTHRDMRMLSSHQQREELLSSKMRIEDKVGYSVKYFSFPYGKFNSDLVELALNCGYEKVCTSQHGIVHFPGTVIPRNSINGAMSWGAVRKVLEAGNLIRYQWIAEDAIKRSLMRTIGDDNYRLLRNVITGMRKC
jgi:peptidoglycan/xylan/chitin deacetylase (PgdA/CDA1 family)